MQTVEAVPAYLYQDNNYFMLRDLGKILGYRVDWNEAKKQASLTKESAAQDLQHLSAAKQAKAVKQSKQTILVGATEYENMNCLNIDGYNYFKLRDLVEIMDFTCGWDSEKNRIQLSTGEQNDEGVSISVKDFLVEGAKQKVIEEDVPYIPGTKDYAALEAYMQKNVDQDFKASDFIITEAEATNGPIMTIGNTQTPVKFHQSPDDYMEEWFAEAPTHHFAMSVGHNGRLFEKVACLLGIPAVVLDRNT